MTGIRLSIDYGTTNTVAVVELPGQRRQPLLFNGLPLLPSGVCAAADGRLLAGWDAAQAARLEPARFLPNPRRHIDAREAAVGDRTWPVRALIAATLAEVAAEAHRVGGASAVDQVVLVHPACWGMARREVLISAATAAGLPVPVLVAAPVAAAGHLGALPGPGLPPGQSIVVYHLGAGTFEACVVRRDPAVLQPLAQHGLDDFGGIELDAVLTERIAAVLESDHPEPWRLLHDPQTTEQRRAAYTFRDDVRAAREALSRNASTGVPVPMVDREVGLTRDEFDQAVGAGLGRTVEATMAAVHQAHVGPPDVAAVLLVGGASRTPLVATLLSNATGKPVTMFEVPETAAAHGALDVAPYLGSAAGGPVSGAGGPVSGAGGPVSAVGGPVSGAAQMAPGLDAPPSPRPMAPAPTTPPVPARPGRRRLVLLGAAALTGLALLCTIALVAFWPRTGTVHPSAHARSTHASRSPRPLATRSGAPHTDSTFANNDHGLCTELDYAPLSPAFGQPTGTPKPGMFTDTEDICVRAFGKQGVPSPTASVSQPGIGAPGTTVMWNYYPTPEAARKHATDLYRTDSWSAPVSKQLHTVEVGDMGYTYRLADYETKADRNVAVVCVITGNVSMFIEVIDPDSENRWDATTSRRALDAATTFVHDNLHLVEHS